MTRERFLERMMEIYRDNAALSKIKNADYGADFDPFQNFRTAEAFNRDTAEGLYFRMMDKMSRIGNGLRQELKVSDESILDTLSDLCNYSVILRMWIEEKQRVIKLSDASGKTSDTVYTTLTTGGTDTLTSEITATGDFRVSGPEEPPVPNNEETY